MEVENSMTQAKRAVSLLQKHKEREAIELSDSPEKKSIPGQSHWGYHLIIDASLANGNIDNPRVILEFLDDLVKRLKMKPLGAPVIEYAEDEEGRGYSAIRMVTTSHFSIHCDDTRRSVYCDIFSCKSFEPSTALRCFQEYFSPKKLKHLWILRDAGNYPMAKED
jgi:S-adenosylmethionine/arginine decarboxylase-like enzyme